MEHTWGNMPLQGAYREEEGGEVLGIGEWSAGDVDLLASWIAGDDDVDVDNANKAESDTSTSSTATTSPPSCGASSNTVSRDRNPTRHRQRQELTYLRSRVDEMERELTQLRGDTEPNAPASEWEAIAKRQQRAREKSELENLKLRIMLESQLKLARTLERLLRKCESASALDSRGSKKRRPALDVGPPMAQLDQAVFERLLFHIDRSYAETAAVLAANGLLTAPRGHRCVEIKHAPRAQGDGGPYEEAMHELYVEMTDVTTLPFSMEATVSAAWRCITGGFMQLDHEVYMGLAGQDDVLAIKYAITLSRRRLHVDFTARAAMKRFVERNQIVEVWESISDSSGGHTSPRGTRGVRVRERGWTVFHSVDGDPTRTRVLTCMQMMPLVSYNTDNGSKSSEDRQVGLLTNLALDYYGDQLDLAQHAMESLLLDEARDEASIAPLPPRVVYEDEV